MIGSHHQLDEHEFEQPPGDGEGRGSLGCCSPWGRRESDTTEQLDSNSNSNNPLLLRLPVSEIQWAFLSTKKKKKCSGF